jgi:uncharacterized membrane protein YfcA
LYYIPDLIFNEEKLVWALLLPFIGFVIGLTVIVGLGTGLPELPGVLLVPIMVLVLRMPFKTVAATSIFTLTSFL